ncbi:butyrophilin subfamily 1 member A1-like isoform X5 [Dicentrarchus labrax]|uniref:Ig-like domain-containing protein n=1 Tax=Dicentrarchus labrax TaxID=13489 RepID=A0A8C4I1E5_DICLA|nr:butyrophilin subfamily 1 member A1-like isoform X5 [Dicentrarchus labrax]
MMCPKTELHNGLSFGTRSVLLCLILTFTVCVAEQSELICSHQPIVALAGDDVILPCYLDPPISASSKTVVWTRPGLDPKYIHVHYSPVYLRQNPSYNNRTRLFDDELQNGNVSMKIFKVKISDAGKYFCTLRSMLKEASIQLTVGAVSTPIIEVVAYSTTNSVLQCESKGWYPEPEVVWLDGEGNLLSAGPTETVRGPDDLYTVSSRVTVENIHHNFTCRVQQKDINQTRETHFNFIDGSVPAGTIVVTVSVPVFVVILAIFICWKCCSKS